jgi:hypothetical protein
MSNMLKRRRTSRVELVVQRVEGLSGAR